MGNLILILCAIMWGISTFLNRLSVEHMSPVFLQVIVGFCYMLFLPFAIKMSGAMEPGFNWSFGSIALTLVATGISICANVLMYMVLKGSHHTGSMAMLISLYPAVTMILSVIFLHEQVTTTKIFGVIAMIGGAILLSLK